MYRYCDPIKDASAYYDDMDDRAERFQAWEENKCVCACGKEATYLIDGDYYCEECANGAYLIDGDKFEYSVDGELMSESQFFSNYYLDDDRKWEEYQKIA